jgi:predicted transposase/invertase (TIGR01784 family)
MTELQYKFTNDMLFKTLFVKYPDLLKKLVAALLGIAAESIGDFIVTNPEIPSEALGEKFCRLDINMTVDGRRVDLEVQVDDEGDYIERSLYYWARDYSSALPVGGDYADLPRVVIISILAFKLFDCEEYHSEYRPLEVTRHTPLTDKQSLHYFELPKLPQGLETLTDRELWLSLLNAKTEEDLSEIEKLGVPEMTRTIEAYRAVTVTDEFREKERLYARARSNEAAALRHARALEREKVNAEWQGIVADKDAALADKDAEIARLRALLQS